MPVQLTLRSCICFIETRASSFMRRAAHALAVEVGEERRLRVAARADRGAATHRLRALDQPRWAVVESLFGAELDHRAAHVLVAVEDVHVACARPVRRARQRPCERCVLDPRADEDVLAGLHVRTDLDGHGGIPLEAFV